METPAVSDFQACKFADGGNSSVKMKKSHGAWSTQPDLQQGKR